MAKAAKPKAVKAPKAPAKDKDAELARNVRRFHALHAELKEGEAQMDGLKKYFRERAGDTDTVFVDKDLEVPVTWEERSGWDGAKLEQHFGEKAPEFKKTSRFAKVGCRRAKAAA